MVTAPSGTQTTVSNTVNPSSVCTGERHLGALTLVGAGTCEVTITAPDHGNWNEVTARPVTVASAGTLSLSVNTIATDNPVNIAEKAAGFTIEGDTGSESGVGVTMSVGTGSLSATSDASGTCR